jgi:16S rRNA (adenine1518-N6/adenine1519-N6)-dimethyltransferase
VNARELLAKHGLSAKKSWGQNFLVEERTFAAIVAASVVAPDDWVIEIGAGLGTLTTRLAARARRVVALERERDMLAVLRAELGGDARVEIVEANALTFDYGAAAAAAGSPPAVVGNLPYQIASPILLRVLAARAHVRRVVVMLQREVAERILARPDEDAYGALSVLVQMSGEPSLVCRVRPGAFVPPPRVDSAVIQVVPFPGGRPRAAVKDEALFVRTVDAAFRMRRKTLRNALAPLAGTPARAAQAIEAAGVDPGRRGETLSVEELARVADRLADA